MANVCPKGHFSSDSEFCSDCGMPMKSGAPSVVAAPASAPVVAAGGCPDCGTARTAGSRFCEVCRYDFDAKQSFSGLSAPAPAAAPVIAAAAAPVATPAPASAPAVAVAAPAAPIDSTPSPHVSAPIAPVANPALATRLQLRIVVDPSVYPDQDPDSPAPVGAPDKIFHLDLQENTLGSRYESQGIHPEIVVKDPGISGRHLKFVREADGSYSMHDVGSSNGTVCNGKPLPPGIVVALKPGDQVELGMWTRIRVEAR